jgi:hypothetical protein
MLGSGFKHVARGELRPPSVRLVPLAEVARAHRELAHLHPGEKIVLTMEG